MPVARVVSASARTAPGKPALLPALTLVPDIRKSVYAKTQKEVRKKMTEAIAALDKDDYREPSKMTVGQ